MAKTAPTYAEFIVLYPEFAATAQAVIEARLSFSARLLDVAAWKDFFSDAVGLDAAHHLALQQSGMGAQGAIGPISSVSAAGVSTSFNSPSVESKNKSEVWYMKTGYGQQFLLLRGQVIPPGLMTV